MYLHVLQVYVPTEALVAWCQEQKSGRRLGKNFKRRKDFLRDLGMLPDGFPVTLEDPITDSLVTVTQVNLNIKTPPPPYPSASLFVSFI